LILKGTDTFGSEGQSLLQSWGQTLFWNGSGGFPGDRHFFETGESNRWVCQKNGIFGKFAAI